MDSPIVLQENQTITNDSGNGSDYDKNPCLKKRINGMLLSQKSNVLETRETGDTTRSTTEATTHRGALTRHLG